MKIPIQLLTHNSTYGKFGSSSALYPAAAPGSCGSQTVLSQATAETGGDQGNGISEPLQTAVAAPVVSANEQYNLEVADIRLRDANLADIYASLKMFESPFVGLITTIDLASKHILKCMSLGQPITEHYPKPVELVVSCNPRYAHHRRKLEAVASARKEWKAAVLERKKAIETWDQFVKAKHDEFKRLFGMVPSDFKDYKDLTVKDFKDIR